MSKLSKFSGNSRHATWLELFFDLIFVVAIAKAAHVLLHAHNGHLTAETYIKYCLIMIPLWWAWTGCTLYATRYDCDDVVQRVMSFLQMFCIIILSTYIHTDFNSHYHGFLFAYIGIRFFTILMYVRASIQDHAKQRISNYLAFSFSMGIVISLSSLFFDGLLRYTVLYTGIGFDIAMSLIGRKRLQEFPVNAHHLPERFGLLTIILLGESVLSLATSFEVLSWSYIDAGMVACGFIIICGLWWLYFENLERRIIGQTLGHGHGIIYSHLLIYIALGAVAAMIRFAIVPGLSLLDYKLLSALGLFGFIISLQFLHIIYHSKKMKRHLIKNAAIFNFLLFLVLVVSSTIAYIMIGAALLISAYAIIDHRNYQQQKNSTT